METLSNRYKLYTCIEPKGVVIFLHGAMEYEGRYHDFFQFLNDNHYLVATYNHEGHGIKENEPHLIKNIKNLEYDAIDLKKELDNIYPNLDHHVIGHSMGSIIARNLISHREYKFNKVIITGTPNPSSLKVEFGIVFINLLIKIKGGDYVSKLANFMTFGEFASKMKLRHGTRNWINSNKEEFGKYLNDPLCNNMFSNNYILALLTQTKKVISSSNIANLKSHEYLVLNGTHDPVNGFGKQLKRFSSLHQINYQKMRHEVLFETGKQMVYDDILRFLEK